MVEAIRRQLPPGSDPDTLVFTGPGGGPGHPSGPSVPRGTRTVLSRSNFRRTYHGALVKLADPTGQLRPTARRTLRALRDGGPQHVDQLAARLAANGRRPVRQATVAVALQELRAAGLAAVDGDHQDGLEASWAAAPPARHPLLDAVDLHGAHDFRHTFSTVEVRAVKTSAATQLRSRTGAEPHLGGRGGAGSSGWMRCHSSCGKSRSTRLVMTGASQRQAICWQLAPGAGG